MSRQARFGLFFASAVAPTVLGGFVAVEAFGDGVSGVLPVGVLSPLASFAIRLSSIVMMGRRCAFDFVFL